MIVLFKRGAKLFQLTMSSLEGAWTEDRPEFEKIAGSFAVD
jgi:hypothetical protein